MDGQEGSEETFSRAHPFRAMLLTANKQINDAANRKIIFFGFKKVI